jgi:hypothetical protein
MRFIADNLNIVPISPYCEEEMINFSFNLPDEYRVHNFEMRYIFRDIFINDIPKKVFYKNYSP